VRKSEYSISNKEFPMLKDNKNGQLTVVLGSNSKFDLQERLVKFAVRIIKICEKFFKSQVPSRQTYWQSIDFDFGKMHSNCKEK